MPVISLLGSFKTLTLRLSELGFSNEEEAKFEHLEYISQSCHKIQRRARQINFYIDPSLSSEWKEQIRAGVESIMLHVPGLDFEEWEELDEFKDRAGRYLNRMQGER